MAAVGRDPVLIFYRDFEADKFVPYDRYLKRVLRPAWNLLHSRQKLTGFFVSFRLLMHALERVGVEVRVNDHRFARRHPEHPVGLIGYPTLLDDWRLPNPALLGPSLYDHPGQAPRLLEDPRFRKYLVLAPWTHAMFRPYYGDACVPWFAGIDTEAWPDTSGREKDLDVLIYDKIRWERDSLVPRLIGGIRDTLARRGRSFAVVRYKHHDHNTYRRLLERARAMVFVCEHETQGIAYQEAMASNLPILAWDQGYWADPLWRQFSQEPIPASSVPFFSPECGERFADMDAFEATFDRFWERLPTYAPRRHVQANLSPRRSAEIYLDAYWRVAERPGARAA